jgi:hypothetical protein
MQMKHYGVLLEKVPSELRQGWEIRCLSCDEAGLHALIDEWALSLAKHRKVQLRCIVTTIVLGLLALLGHFLVEDHIGSVVIHQYLYYELGVVAIGALVISGIYFSSLSRLLVKAFERRCKKRFTAFEQDLHDLDPLTDGVWPERFTPEAITSRLYGFARAMGDPILLTRENLPDSQELRRRTYRQMWKTGVKCFGLFSDEVGGELGVAYRAVSDAVIFARPAPLATPSPSQPTT